MHYLSEIPVVGPVLADVIPFLIVLGVVVFVHEFGHYIVARLSGIRAEVFSIGFGPRIWARRDRRGTEWQVAALPLGGYVRFVGDMDPASAGQADDAALSEEDRKAAFHNARLRARAATVVAGPAFNFLLSIVIFAALALAIGRPSDAPVIGALGPRMAASKTVDLKPGDRVLDVEGQPVSSFVTLTRDIVRANGKPITLTVERAGKRMDVTVQHRMAAEVDMVTPGMPASQAGLAPGDRVVDVNGAPVGSFYDLQVATAGLPLDKPIDLTVERGGKLLDFSVKPVPVTRPNPVTGKVEPIPTIGISAPDGAGMSPTTEPIGPGIAIEAGVLNTWEIIAGTGRFLGDLVFHHADTSQLGGPIRIAQISGQRAQQGFLDFVHLIAVISTSIGLINLFPVPVLDGGHLMFYAIEAVRGRPAGGLAIRFGTAIGLSLVLLLMVFATYNDLLRL